MKPVDVCSGYILSGVFQFVLLTIVSLNMAESEKIVEEQLILFHGKSRGTYCIAREMTLFVISCFYGLPLILVPVIANCLNHFSLFIRTLSASDVVAGAMIICGSGLAGIAIGDALHPRIIRDRKLAVVAAVGIMILSITKDGVIKKYGFPMFVGILFPSVMKPARDLGSGDYFEIKAVFAYLFMMMGYYLIVAVIKNLILNRKKF